jgi:hypothetical protein
LTEHLGVRFEEDYAWLARNAASPLIGWQNLQVVTQYLAIPEPAQEALVTLGVNRQWGGTGARRIGASTRGATVPTGYFAKGMGDLDLGYLPPLAVTASIGYQFADAPSRPDNLLTGIAVEYSIPYLQSKVRSFDLPDVLRRMTPQVQTFVTTPTSNRCGGPAPSSGLASTIPGTAGNSSRPWFRPAAPSVPASV